MKIVKKLMAVIALAALSMSFTACGSQEAKEPVVAKIGDETITKSQLDNAMAQTDYYLQQNFGTDFKENAQFIPTYNNILDQNVEQLIGYKIIVMKAKERGDIKVTDDEIEEQITTIKGQFKSEDEFKKAMEEQNTTLDVLKKDIEENLYYKKMIDDYKSKVNVTDQDISDYYNKNTANYTKQPGATISHILVDSEDKAKEVLQKYKDGTSFEELAAQYGTDGTKSTGGSLGYIEYDTQQYDADFMAAAKKLGEGEVSDPVKTQFGWHLIKVDGIHDKEFVQPLEEVSSSIKEQLEDEQTNDAITADVENWKKEYKIETYAENYQLKVPEESTSPTASDAAPSSTAAPEETESSAK